MSEMTTQEPAHWLVYSRQHNAWWRPKAAGYCTHIDGAGRFTREKAEACASSRSVTDPEAPPEFMVPAPEAYEAIAARLKALEEMRERVHILAETGLSWQLQGHAAADELRAILDTVREGS